MTVSVIFTSVEIYNGVLSVFDGIIPLTSQAVESAVELFAGVDSATVTSSSSMTDLEFSKFVTDANTVTSVASVSAVEAGNTYLDSNIEPSVAVPSATEQGAFIDAATITAISVPSTTENGVYIDSATITSVAACSGVEGNVVFESATITAISRPSAPDQFIPLDSALITSIGQISTNEAMEFHDDTSVVTSIGLISGNEVYNAQNIYTDSNITTSVAAISSTDGKFWTDAATETAVAAPSSQGVLPGQFVQLVGVNTAGTGQQTTVTINAPSGGCRKGNSLVFAAISTTQPLTSITDTQGNTWTVDSTIILGSETVISVGSTNLTHELTSLDTITGTYNAIIAGRAAICCEYQGILSSSYVDSSVINTASATNVQPLTVNGAASTTQNDLIVGIFGLNGTPSVTTDAQSTLRATAAASASTRTLTFQDYLSAFPGAQSVTLTATTLRDIAGILAAYKATTPGLDSIIRTDSAVMTGFSVIQSTDSHIYPSDAATVTAGALATTGITNSFEGGTNGTTITAANSGGTSGTAFTTVNPTPTFSSTHAAHGTLAANVTNGTLQWTTSSLTDGYVRAYVYLTSYPSPAADIILMSGSINDFFVFIDPSGHILIEDNAFTIQATSTNVVPLNTWFRIECHHNSTAQGVVRYYIGDSTTITETLTASGGTAFSVTDVTFLHGWFDDVNAFATTWPGPAAGGGASATDVFNALDATTVTAVAQPSALESGKTYTDSATITAVAAPSLSESFEGYGLFDDFNRTPVSNGWGTPIRGNAWTVSSGATSHFSTDGTFAYIALNSTSGHIIYSSLNDPAASSDPAETKYNVGMLTKFQWDLKPAGAFSEPINHCFWFDTTTSNQMRLRLKIDTSSALSMGLFTYTGAQGNQQQIVGFTQFLSSTAVNTDYWLRTEATGLDVSSVHARARIWQDGTTEPSTWNIDSTFTTNLPGTLINNYTIRANKNNTTTNSPTSKYSFMGIYYIPT